MKRVILLSVLILLISLGYSFADVPCKINYQGRLIKDNVPVDGTKTMRFSIHDSAVSGNELWTSGDVDITVHNGLFRYILGSDGGDLSSIDWTAGEELYLEVTVGGETLSPREQIYAYPYAINTHLLEGRTTAQFLDVSGSTQTKQGGLNIMGNVGIGTTEPGAELDVNGNIRANNGYCVGAVASGIKIEYGNVNVEDDRASDTWYSVTFSQAFTTPPSVFVKTITYDGVEDPNLRIQNVTTTGFEMRFDEQNSPTGVKADGSHGVETVSWIAIGN